MSARRPKLPSNFETLICTLSSSAGSPSGTLNKTQATVPAVPTVVGSAFQISLADVAWEEMNSAIPCSDEEIKFCAE
ncbi:hypothetical protein BVI1335_1520012 [Burkholderia vietnamiensis]|nr:hypothetical protein BVI1335_1520012 [Burkholderia vietnamiensis]